MTDRQSRLVIRLNAADNVVIARADIVPGTPIESEGIAIRQPIPSGHKIATRSIAEGEPVSVPVVGLSVSPVGSVPENRLYVGVGEPLATKVWE